MTSLGRSRRPALLVLSLCCSTAFAHAARAQTGIGLQTCEDLKITKKQYGSLPVETAACLNPAKTFRPKGTLRNVHILATFPAVPTGAKITFLVTETDADGEDVQYVDYWASPHHTTAYAQLTINKPGKYFVRMVNTLDRSQVWATTDFTVGDELKLPAGAYSVYIIAWGKREVLEHRGNLSEYFAKTVLTVN